MKRRDLITLIGGAAAAAFTLFPLRAQQSTATIGFLSARSREESAHLVDAFRRGLIEQGIVEGQHMAILYRFADGHYDRLPAQAAELVHQPVSVLVAVGGDMTARAAISATRIIPIVSVFIGDPVVNGLVASLNRPGGNVTGVSNLNAGIESKRLGLLKELVPQAGTVAALQNPDSPTAGSNKRILKRRREPWEWTFGSGKPLPNTNLRQCLKQ
jgi:putative ABC transport system substrate-binding protein